MEETEASDDHAPQARHLQQAAPVQLEAPTHADGQAVLLCGTIQKRDARNFAHQLKEKDEQLQKLKTYPAKADNLRRPKTSVFGAGRIKSHTGSRLPRRKKQRPSRNLHTEAALPMSPRS